MGLSWRNDLIIIVPPNIYFLYSRKSRVKKISNEHVQLNTMEDKKIISNIIKHSLYLA